MIAMSSVEELIERADMRLGPAGRGLSTDEQLIRDLANALTLARERIEAASVLLKRMDELEGDLEGFFVLAQAKGVRWTAGN